MFVHILHVVDSLGTGGLENGLVNLIQHLDPGQFEHTVLAIRGLGANAERLPRDRVRVLSLEKKDTDSRVQIAALVRRIRAIQPDIVHSRNWGAMEAVLATRWLRTCRAVHSEHGFDTPEGDREPRRRAYFRRIAFELADQVLMVSEELKSVHVRRTGFQAGRVAVIHNGVDNRRFRPDAEARARARRQFGFSENDFVVGCVGRLAPVKDHLTLLRSLQSLSREGGGWRLLILGDGPERGSLEAFLSENPEVGQGTRLIGSTPQVPEFLNAFDAYVLPSISEGISNSLLEAMATGLPVVATAVGGNPEVVTDGDSGLLFPARDWQGLAALLLRLREKQEWRMELGRQARRRIASHFSMESMARKYEQVYTGLVDSADRRPAEMVKA